MYQQDTQFGFTGSQLGALPTTLDQINPAYYQQISQFVDQHGGRLASVFEIDLYDTLRIDGGLLPTNEFIFYQNGVGQSQGLFVANTQYRKQEIDVTPWVKNGQLSTGYAALVWEMQVQINTVQSIDKSVQTSGNAINLTLDPGVVSGEAATDVVKQANILRACQEGLYFELFVNNTTFEHGTSSRFPTYLGIGGGNSVAGVVAAPIGDGALTNGLGFVPPMPVMRYIPSLTAFGVRMKVQNPFTLANVGPIRIVTHLRGIGVQPVTG